MIQLFSADAVTNNTDQSLSYLGNVFGNMYGLFPGAGDETILGIMFEQFNLMILTVGILMVLYVTVVGLMNTAHEGEFMGKRWNNMWIPIRAVLGIATLVPMSGGFCVLQFVMMWAIVQGIAGADVVWHTALSFIAQTGSPFASISLPGTQAQATLNSLFNGIVCEQTTAQTTPDIVPGMDGNKNAYFCYRNPQNAACINPLMDPVTKMNFLQALLTPLNSPTIPFQMGPDGTCGTLVFSNPLVVCAQQGSDSLQCVTSQAQFTALKNAFPIMTTFARNFMELDKAYQQFFQNSTNGSVSLAPYLPPIPGSVSTGPATTAPTSIGDGALAALLYCQTNNVNPCDYTTLPKPLGDNMNAPNNVVDEVYWPYMQKTGPITAGSGNPLALTMAGYTAALQATVTSYLSGACSSSNPSATSNPNCPQLSGFLGAADSSGWISAGSYYLILARMNSNNLKSSMPVLSYNIDPKIAATSPNSTINNYRNLYNSADELAYLAAGGTPSSGTNSLNDKASQATSSGVADMNTQMSNQTEPNSMRAAPVDPISQLTGTGYALMLIASIIYLVLLVIFTIIAVLVGIDVLVLGSGITEDPAKEAFWFLMMMMMPLVFMLLGVMVSVGATFGIYIPFIPFTVFMVGAIGWMISTVEAMVAGPLVALGIISPSGQHEVLGKAEPALMLLFGICLRPTLMIFGMFAAMLLSAQVMNFVDAGFYLVYSNMFDLTNNGNTPSAGGQAALAANPVASIMILIVYCGTVVTALNKTFSAIYIIPERTMRWISGTGESHGEEHAAGKLEGSVSGGGSGMTGGYEKGTSSSSGLVSKAGSKEGKGSEPAVVAPGKGGEGPANKGEKGNHP